MRDELIKALRGYARDDVFWRLLAFLDSLREPAPLADAAGRFGCGEERIHEVLDFLRFFDCGFEVRDAEGGPVVVPPGERRRVTMEMTLPEWFALQAQFPYVPGQRKPAAHRLLMRRFLDVKMRHPDADLCHHLRRSGGAAAGAGGAGGRTGLVDAVEEAMESGLPVDVALGDGGRTPLLPMRVVFLEGRLSLVGEELRGRTLASIPVEDVASVEPRPTEEERAPNFSQLEVDDFIGGIRSVSGNEERLVLKVLRPDAVDLCPDHHHFANPYLATNPVGDLIWAGSVEVSDDLFDWVRSMGDHVRILENESLREQYEDYLDRRPPAR